MVPARTIRKKEICISIAKCLVLNELEYNREAATMPAKQNLTNSNGPLSSVGWDWLRTLGDVPLPLYLEFSAKLSEVALLPHSAPEFNSGVR